MSYDDWEYKAGFVQTLAEQFTERFVQNSLYNKLFQRLQRSNLWDVLMTYLNDAVMNVLWENHPGRSDEDVAQRVFDETMHTWVTTHLAHEQTPSDVRPILEKILKGLEAPLSEYARLDAEKAARVAAELAELKRRQDNPVSTIVREISMFPLLAALIAIVAVPDASERSVSATDVNKKLKSIPNGRLVLVPKDGRFEMSVSDKDNTRDSIRLDSVFRRSDGSGYNYDDLHRCVDRLATEKKHLEVQFFTRMFIENRCAPMGFRPIAWFMPKSEKPIPRGVCKSVTLHIEHGPWSMRDVSIVSDDTAMIPDGVIQRTLPLTNGVFNLKFHE